MLSLQSDSKLLSYRWKIIGVSFKSTALGALVKYYIELIEHNEQEGEYYSYDILSLNTVL